MIFFLLAVAYHWIDRFVHPVESYNFSQFEEKFHARHDSIHQVLKKGSVDKPSGTSNSKDLQTNPSGLKNLENPNTGITTEEVNPSSPLHTNQPPDLININTATIEELITLPRIGPKIAAAIVDYRNQHGKFKVKEDLINVKRIGPKTFENLRHLITVE